MVSELLSVDFDAHASALRKTGAKIIFTARSQSAWHLNKYQLTHLQLELRNEGGASITAGAPTADLITFAVTSTAQAKELVVNGQRITPTDLVIIPPALKLIKASFGPHTWIQVSASRVDVARLNALSDLCQLFGQRRLIVIRSPTLSQRVIDVASIIAREIMQNGVLPSHTQIRELEQSLIDAISTVSQVALVRIDETLDRRRARSARHCELAHNAVELIDDRDAQHNNVSEFCEALGVTKRELRRSFKSFFVMGPTRLARLHRANRIRRMLVDGVKRDTRIMDLLAAADISEPGRFSGEYKALFGESPSATRKRFL